jgi:hypothetical protein
LIAGSFVATGVPCSNEEAPPLSPPEILVAEVVQEVFQKDVPIYVELVGSTLGSEDVEIRAEWEVTSFRLTSQKAPSSARQPRLLEVEGVRVSRRASAGKAFR